MPGQKMAYLETALLAHALGGTIWTPPTTYYAVLSTDAFDPTLTGDSVIEPTAGDYARLAITNDTSNFPAPTGSNPASTANALAWGFPSAVADWGTILSVYLADAATSGNLCYGTPVAGAGVPITAGSSFNVPINAFLARET